MGIGIKEILLVLLVVLLIFGTGRLKGIGTDLGEAIKGFRRGMKEPGKDPDGNPSA